MKDEIKYCMDCGEELVVRIQKSTGDKFYGCSSHPNCKYTECFEEEVDDDNVYYACRSSTEDFGNRY